MIYLWRKKSAWADPSTRWYWNQWQKHFCSRWRLTRPWLGCFCSKASGNCCALWSFPFHCDPELGEGACRHRGCICSQCSRRWSKCGATCSTSWSQTLAGRGSRWWSEETLLLSLPHWNAGEQQFILSSWLWIFSELLNTNFNDLSSFFFPFKY